MSSSSFDRRTRPARSLSEKQTCARTSLLFAALFMLLTFVALAQTPPGRTSTKDYAPYPQPDSGYVSDLAGLLTDAEEERIERWLLDVERRSGVEIIVVTIGSVDDYPGTENQSVGSFATALFDAYAIGNLPQNDGVLLLVARSDRKATIALGGGYGQTRNAQAAKIIENVIVSRFRAADHSYGITKGVEALAWEFASVRVGFPWKLLLLPLGVIAALLIVLSLFRNGKKGWGWVFVGVVIIFFAFLLFMLFGTLRSIARSPGRSSGWTVGGSGGFGGGFSRGGGATGSW